MVGLLDENVIDTCEKCTKLADGKTAHESRFGVPCDGPVIPFGGNTQLQNRIFHESRLHQFRKKMLIGNMHGLYLTCGGR